MLTRIDSGMLTMQALDRQAVDRLDQDAAGGDAGCGAAELDLDVERDRLVGGDAIEIDVEDIVPERVPLDVAEQGLLRRCL